MGGILAHQLFSPPPVSAVQDGPGPGRQEDREAAREADETHGFQGDAQRRHGDGLTAVLCWRSVRGGRYIYIISVYENSIFWGVGGLNGSVWFPHKFLLLMPPHPPGLF